MSSLASGIQNVVGQGLGASKNFGLLTELTGEPLRIGFFRSGSGGGLILQFDAAMNEAHGRESGPTMNPIEDGGVVSDHIILTPYELQLTGVVTDDPLYDPTRFLNQGIGAAATSLTPPLGVVALGVGFAAYTAQQNTERRSLFAYRTLTNLQEARAAFTVTTRYRRYTNMVIKSLSFPRDASTSGVCVFTVSLTEIKIVAPQTVAISALENPALGANLKKAGEKDAESTDVNGFTKGRDREKAVVKALGQAL